jgi:hypothetical protein
MRGLFVVPASIMAFSLFNYACSSSSTTPGFGNGDDGGSATDDGGGTTDDGGLGSDAVVTLPDGSNHDTGTVMTVDTIYAHTDTELYSMDPSSHTVTLVGSFAGVGGTTNDTAVTDLAVNANKEIYVNSKTVLYKAALPSGGTGTVQLTRIAKIATVSSTQFFWALAFAPAGVLGSGETLVGGDDKGDLYAIDPTNGQTKLLGGFGGDWELSGDIVFYTQNGTNLGLATIRHCPIPSGSTKPVCDKTNDSLAEIDMAALTAAYNGSAGAPLLAKTYGNGTTYGELFGVGAWQDKVYAFARVQTGSPAQLVSIDSTGTGVSLQPFANITAGWSGAGVTTKATITVPPPPR